MTKTFAFFYLMANDPAKIGQTLPAHVAHWKSAALDHYAGGPFADRSGGLITFVASDLDEARQLAARDPFAQKSLLREQWLKEWLPE